MFSVKSSMYEMSLVGHRVRREKTKENCVESCKKKKQHSCIGTKEF